MIGRAFGTELWPRQRFAPFLCAYFLHKYFHICSKSVVSKNIIFKKAAFFFLMPTFEGFEMLLLWLQKKHFFRQIRH